MNKHKQLTRTAVTGTLWNYGAFALSKGLIFISTVILARILVPEQFGLMALGLLVISYLDTLADFGVGAALIYRQEDPDRTSSVAFMLSAIVGLALAATAFFFAPAVATFFHEPKASPIIQVLSLSFIISGLTNIHESRVKKYLNFKRRFIAETGKSLAKGGVAIGMALTGFGVWSLVWGQLAGGVTTALLYWWMSPWRPRFIIDAKIARSLLHYGGHIVLVGILGAILKNVDYLIIGRRLDTTELGYYTMAFRLPELAILSICYVVSQALFPAYARLQNNWPALRMGVLTSLRYVALITIPTGVGMALVAPEFIRLFYTEKWAPAIPVMQMLAIYALVETLGFNTGDVYKAVGRPDILNRIGLIKLVIAVPVIWFAADYGIFHVAMAQTGVTLIFTVLSLAIACRIIALHPVNIFQAISPAVMATTVMATGMTILRLQLDQFGDAATLAALVSTGVLLFGLTLWLTNRELIESAIALLQPLKRNSGGTEKT